jgi:acyl-CoA synthetase (NDP forming)
MDVGMQLSGPDDFFRVLEVVVKDPNIDIIFMIAMIFSRRMGWWGGARNLLKTLVKFAKQPRRQPFVIAIRCPTEQLETEKDRLWVTERFVKAGIPVFKTVERAARALYKYTEYYRRLAEIEKA